jgi:hypothetical protein
MPSERVQRQIDRLLDEAEQASASEDWSLVQQRSKHVLTFDPENADAVALLAAAERGLQDRSANQPKRSSRRQEPADGPQSAPTSFANGRYQVRSFLGEGGKKKVYLAHDTTLDRDVAFALIKTEGLDDIGRDRVAREAQAMGRLGAHPHIVSVYDLGDEDGQPYMVTELMGGGDVEGLIEKAPDHRLDLSRTLEIGAQVCEGLEFAHGQKIVHRDLKPGNVWLTADGVAKVGDFGLAVAIDKTRLTQAGMMVGTVNYMPPEQATGGEVTPRSDLYSLGAMLYEMVTDRPPFVGDEAVAIIGQHLNTPPVAPSWHNRDCPPGLESLILRLLEKDPNKRPQSAEEVRKALESVGQAMGSRQSAVGEERDTAGQDLLPTALDNPLYRRVFVGREQELKQLQAAFDAALSGKGALAMVVGEPGIGKTALCEQLATYAGLRGGKTLVGHCYEEGSLSLPYLPFVEAMRSYVLAREPAGLKSDLGSGAGEVARIVSEVRDRVQVQPSHPTGDPDEERYRLLQAVTNFLCNAAKIQPLLIVLEDLHDADRGTLDLLLHLSRNTTTTRLFMIGTYRDVEVDRAHPLSATLAELRRSAAFQRMQLRGLTVDEVHRMMNAIRGQSVPWSRAEALHRQTEGNPLFIQEVLRYLVEEGLVVREGGRYARTDGSPDPGAGIPEGLRDVIGKRLSHLSPQTNQILGVAAVVGRDFRLDVLHQVTGVSDEELDAALEEAAGRSLIEQRPILGSLAFRFTHAFFRQTLYEEIFASRRLRLHQQVARALEAVYGRRIEEHAAELAEHYAQSTDAADLAKALQYSEAAAQRATNVFAYGEAERHLEQALKVQDVLDPDNRAKRCDLLLGLGEALTSAGQPQRAAEIIAPESFALAEQLGDHAQACRACALAFQALQVYQGGAVFRTLLWREWAERADRFARPDTAERVTADVQLGRANWAAGQTVEGWRLARRALELADNLDDPNAIRQSVSTLLGWPALPQHHEERRRLVLDLEMRRRSASDRLGPLGFTTAPFTLLSFGERQRAEEAWRETAKVAAGTRSPLQTLVATLARPFLATIDGRLEEALAGGAELSERAEELGAIGLGRRWSANCTRTALLYLGRTEEALAALTPQTVTDDAPGASGARPEAAFTADSALCLAHAGRLQEARKALDASLSRNAMGAEEQTPTIVLTWLLEAAVLLEDRNAAALLRSRLSELGGVVATATATLGTCVGRHLGAASALLGDAARAERYYKSALDVAGRLCFRPEIALSRFGLSELLLEGADDSLRAAALEHLDFAIAEFRDMKMQPSLERALRHKEVLKA